VSDILAFVAFGFVSVILNLGLTLLNFKLYTEFAKQRMQEQRVTSGQPGAGGGERK
jgi:hypothetical protein